MRVQMRANASLESKGDFSPVPRGIYLLECKAVKDGTAQSGRQKVNLEMVILDNNAYSGRKIWHNVTFIPEGEKGHGLMVNALHGLGMEFNGDLDFDTQEFIGKSGQALVDVEEYEGKARNKIGVFYTENNPVPAVLPVVVSVKTVSGIRSEANARNTEEVPF